MPIVIKVQLLQAKLFEAPEAFASRWNWVDAYLRLVYYAEKPEVYRMLRQAMMARRALLLIDGLDEGGASRGSIERHSRPRVAMSHGTAAEATYSCLNELENPGPWTTALGVFSICFSATVGIPQAYKIYARRSSRGISMATLGLGNIGGFLYVLNLLILHYNQIVLSYQGDFAYWARAQRSVTFVWVELVNSISMVFVFFVAAETRVHRVHAQGLGGERARGRGDVAGVRPRIHARVPEARAHQRRRRDGIRESAERGDEVARTALFLFVARVVSSRRKAFLPFLASLALERAGGARQRVGDERGAHRGLGGGDHRARQHIPDRHDQDARAVRQVRQDAA